MRIKRQLANPGSPGMWPLNSFLCSMCTAVQVSQVGGRHCHQPNSNKRGCN